MKNLDRNKKRIIKAYLESLPHVMSENNVYAIKKIDKKSK